jgi:hypothetical protein
MVSTSFLNHSGRKMTTHKPMVLVNGTGPTLKIMNTIKAMAHLILALVETERIVFIPIGCWADS